MHEPYVFGGMICRNQNKRGPAGKEIEAKSGADLENNEWRGVTICFFVQYIMNLRAEVSACIFIH